MEWSDDIETVLKTIGIKSFVLSEFHKKRYNILMEKQKYFKIPVIILSGINSVVAVGLSNYMPQTTISMMTCLLSLICGIIGSIELYLKLSELLNIEYIAGRDFYLLHIDILKTLALARERRGTGGETYLDQQFNTYIQLISNAQLMCGDELKHNFNDYMIEIKPRHSPVSSSSEKNESLIIQSSSLTK